MLRFWVMESFVAITECLAEVLLVAAAILLAAALRPWRPEVRVVLAVCGLAAVTFGISLFILDVYPGETLGALTVGALMAGAGWVYRVAVWLVPRTSWVTGRIQRALSRSVGRLRNRQPKRVGD